MINFLILDSIKKHNTIMPLFNAGYSYSLIMKKTIALEKKGYIYFNDGHRNLTARGEKIWEENKEKKYINILPLNQYKEKKMNIDDIYLP